MSTYYHYDEELIGVGMQLGEIALYTGTKLDGLRGGPSSDAWSSNVFVFSREEEGVRGLDLQFENNTLNVSVHEDHYVFLRNEQEDFIQQVSGPAKPVIVGNIGARAIRVDTPLGKFLVPAGAMFRLDENTPLQREKKKVLLTFSDEAKQTLFLQSALMLDGGRWKPLNLCADRNKVKVRDGSFTVQTLAPRCNAGARLEDPDYYARCNTDVILEDPPFESDYEVYLRGTAAWFGVYFAGACMKDEGLAQAYHTFSMKQNEIYDFQRLRQAPTTELMRQCTVQLPGLEELEGSPLPNSADTPDIK